MAPTPDGTQLLTPSAPLRGLFFVVGMFGLKNSRLAGCPPARLARRPGRPSIRGPRLVGTRLERITVPPSCRARLDAVRRLARETSRPCSVLSARLSTGAE